MSFEEEKSLSYREYEFEAACLCAMELPIEQVIQSYGLCPLMWFRTPLHIPHLHVAYFSVSG